MRTSEYFNHAADFGMRVPGGMYATRELFAAAKSDESRSSTKVIRL